MKTKTQTIDPQDIFTRDNVVAYRKVFSHGPAGMYEASGAYAGDFGPSWTRATEEQAKKFNATRKRLAAARKKSAENG